MKIGGRRRLRRSIFLAAACMLAVVLTACTGKGGGYLPPSLGFSGQAPFGFTFSCEDKGGINPPTGKLAIELAYSDLGTSEFFGAPFSIHGIVDRIDPVLESAVCSGQKPPPGGTTLIFLGRYRLTSSPPPDFPSTCPARETKTTPLCRFEVIVQDNDTNMKPSPGDTFSIKLSTVTDPNVTDFPVATIVYARAGILAGGNITVK